MLVKGHGLEEPEAGETDAQAQEFASHPDLKQHEPVRSLEVTDLYAFKRSQNLYPSFL